tara:strand:+ start:298 stop:2223 length:1926 start_codon:yes stop_codon:yes gene_type:complete
MIKTRKCNKRRKNNSIKKKVNKKTYYGGVNVDNSIIIIGAGPSGLFTSIFIYNFLIPCFLNLAPSIIIYGNRFESIGRLRQVIVLKKEYKMVQKLFEIPGLVEFMSDYIECVLYSDTQQHSEYNVGPLLCSNKELFMDRDNFLNNPSIAGITITIYNLEICLYNFIKQNYSKVIFINETIDIDTIVSNNVIILGCSGGGGTIRRKYTKFPNIKKIIPKHRCLLPYNNVWYNKISKLYENEHSGSENDSYMLVLRYPITNNKVQLNDIAFGHPTEVSVNKTQKTDNIMISSYVNKTNNKKFLLGDEIETLDKTETIFYRQLYYYITKNTFKKLSDCGFWNSCSLNDYYLNRTEITTIIEANNLNIDKIIQSIPNYEYSMDSEKDINIPLENITFTIKPVKNVNKRSFFIRQIELTTSNNLLEIFKKNTKCVLIKGIQNRPTNRMIDESAIEITIEEIRIVGYNFQNFDNIYYQIIIKENINIQLTEDEIIYIYKVDLTEEQLRKQKKLTHKIKRDILKFDDKIEIDDNDLVKKTELIRIWTNVRFSSKIYQELNGKKTVILGDESILVNPMTGMGVSNSLLLSYDFIQLLSIDTYENIHELISVFNKKCEIFQTEIYYPHLCDILSQSEKARTSQFYRHDFV